VDASGARPTYLLAAAATAAAGLVILAVLALAPGTRAEETQ
jgi:hypothetical protein